MIPPISIPKIQEQSGAMPLNPTGALLLGPAACVGATFDGLPPPPYSVTNCLHYVKSLIIIFA